VHRLKVLEHLKEIGKNLEYFKIITAVFSNLLFENGHMNRENKYLQL